MKRLELFFENEDGKTVKYTLDYPVEPADPEAIHAAMDEVIEQNAFFSSGGDVVTKKGARIVENIVEEIDLGLEE